MLLRKKFDTMASAVAIAAAAVNPISPESNSKRSTARLTMMPLAVRCNDGVAAEIKKHGLPWNVQRLGCRAEYTFCQRAPRNGGESAAAAVLIAKVGFGTATE